MRPARFHADALRHALRREKIATIEQLKAALGTRVDMTVFRKLREIVYHTSYSHRGKYYALDEIVAFDTRGLWSFRDVHFSRDGSLVDTVERFVQQAERGVLASELATVLHVEVEEPLLRLVQRGRLGREKAGGVYLYGAVDPEQRRQQVLSRQSSEEPRGPGQPPVALEESKAAIVLFLGLLDERQRRMFAGLESMRWGWGGDRRVAEITGLDVHTVARGRRELLGGEGAAERIRRPGGGRKATEKKRRR